MTTMMNVILLGTEVDYDAVSHHAHRVVVPTRIGKRLDIDEIVQYLVDSGELRYGQAEAHTAMSAQEFRREYGPQDIEFWVPDGVFCGMGTHPRHKTWTWERRGFPYTGLGMSLTAIGRDDSIGTIYDHRDEDDGMDYFGQSDSFFD